MRCIKKCLFCGKDFECTDKYRAKTRKYCSKKCSASRLKSAVDNKCELCGKIFQTAASRTAKMCSQECYKKHKLKALVTKKCLQCGKVFTRLKSKGLTLCSRGCSDKYRKDKGVYSKRKVIKTKCLHCNKEFEYKQNKNQVRKYCSIKCAVSYRTVRHMHHEINCKVCGKVFEINDSNFRRGRGVYCSRQCADIGLVKYEKITKTCSMCGKEFMVAHHRSSIAIFCSEACFRKTKKLPKTIRKLRRREYTNARLNFHSTAIDNDVREMHSYCHVAKRTLKGVITPEQLRKVMELIKDGHYYAAHIKNEKELSDLLKELKDNEILFDKKQYRLRFRVKSKVK